MIFFRTTPCELFSGRKREKMILLRRNATEEFIIHPSEREIPQVLQPSGAVCDKCDQGSYKCSQISYNSSAAGAAEENAAETPKATPEATVRRGAQTASHRLNKRGKKKKIKGSQTWKCLRATESDDVSSAAPSRKKKKKRRGLVKNQSVAELQSGGNQEASYAAEPSSGCNEAVV